MFRQASVDVRPSPLPSEPLRFDAKAYPSPKGWRVAQRVLRKPTGQVKATEAHQKPRAYRGDSRRPPPSPRVVDAEDEVRIEPEVPKPKAVVKPMSDGDALDAEYAQNRADDLARLMAPATPALPTAETEHETVAATVAQGAWSTPDQWNAATKKGRKAALKADGRMPIKSSSRVSASFSGRKLICASFRNTPIPSVRDKQKTGKRSAKAAKKENKRPLVPLEVTDELLESVARSALERFKTNRVLDAKRVLISLVDLLSPSDGRGKEGLIAYVVRHARVASGRVSAEDQQVVDKRFLHSAATKALGELIKAAWQMMGPDTSKDVTDDPDARRRVGATRRRAALTTDAFHIRRHVMRSKRVVFFILIVEKSGRRTLQGVVC